MNMHTGAPFTMVLREFIEPALMPVWEQFYRQVHSGLTIAGLRRTTNAAIESDPKDARLGVFNLTSALNMNSGALSILVESPCHCSSTASRDGKTVVHTPDMLVDAQLTVHQEAMEFLVASGGRARWTPAKQ
jgi:hypothetical protein